MKYECPSCKSDIEQKESDKSLTAQFPHFPFCSKKCKEIDLGKWVLEEYQIFDPCDLPPIENS
jgi:endogenous inhibitor of DNA gyrase (YacG/DUF329 family)